MIVSVTSSVPSSRTTYSARKSSTCSPPGPVWAPALPVHNVAATTTVSAASRHAGGGPGAVRARHIGYLPLVQLAWKYSAGPKPIRPATRLAGKLSRASWYRRTRPL